MPKSQMILGCMKCPAVAAPWVGQLSRRRRQPSRAGGVWGSGIFEVPKSIEQMIFFLQVHVLSIYFSQHSFVLYNLSKNYA